MKSKIFIISTILIGFIFRTSHEQSKIDQSKTTPQSQKQTNKASTVIKLYPPYLMLNNILLKLIKLLNKKTLKYFTNKKIKIYKI